MISCRVVGRRARPARLGMPLLEQYWRNQISQTLFGWRMPSMTRLLKLQWSMP